MKTFTRHRLPRQAPTAQILLIMKSNRKWKRSWRDSGVWTEQPTTISNRWRIAYGVWRVIHSKYFKIKQKILSKVSKKRKKRSSWKLTNSWMKLSNKTRQHRVKKSLNPNYRWTLLRLRQTRKRASRNVKAMAQMPTKTQSTKLQEVQ